MSSLAQQIYDSRLHEGQIVYFLSDNLRSNAEDSDRVVKIGRIIGAGSVEYPYRRPLVEPLNGGGRLAGCIIAFAGLSSRGLFTEDEVRMIVADYEGEPIDNRSPLDIIQDGPSNRELAGMLGLIVAERAAEVGCFNRREFER